VGRQFAGIEDPAGLRKRDPVETVATEQEFMGRDKFTFETRPMVAGLFDDHAIELSNSGKWVTISGQDYTALLHGKQWPPTPKGTARRIPTGKRLDLLLGDILREADSEHALEVKVEGLRKEKLPVIGRAESSTNKRGIPIEQNTSYWDVMYKLATRHGCILFVRGLDVVLTKPKNLADIATADIKKLAWGNNLESLKLTRHLGKEKVPRIVITGFDPKSRKTLVVEYPGSRLERKHAEFKPGGARTTTTEKIGHRPKKTKKKKTTAPLKVTDEYQIIPVYGISDARVLKEMAETLYHLRGRGERKVIAVTRDLEDMEESSIMDLSAGDAVDIEFTEFDPAFQRYLSDGKVSETAKVQDLIARGYNADIAATIASNFTLLMGERRPLRVQEVTYEWDAENGLSVELELIDFIVVDGLRDQNHKKRTKNKRADRLVGKDGKPIGNTAIKVR
jgi:hypothetical protein